ncbi:MAG: tetratricopeptide repeat protein [Bacteroidota bacterium]
MRRLVFFLSLVFIAPFYGQDKVQEAFERGVQYLQNRDFHAAETQFKVVLTQGQRTEVLKMANVYMGQSLNGQGQYNNALVFFDKAIELDSLDLKSFIDRGLCFAYAKNHLKAKKDFNHVLSIQQIGPQAEGAYYWLGRLAFANGDMKVAIDNFSQLLSQAPQDAEAYFLRGTAYSNLFEHNEAIANFDLAIEYKPDYMEALANRGVSKMNLVPTKEKLENKKGCFKEPCSDLLRAKELGDEAVDDMIFLYCKKCK